MNIDDIELKSSPLFNLIEIGDFYIKGSASWPEFSEEIKKKPRDSLQAWRRLCHATGVKREGGRN